MTRIPDLDPAALDAGQRQIYAQILSGPRGSVEGPLRVWLRNPGLADTAQRLGAYCRYGTALSPRLSELAIILVGAHWRAGFEWAVHAPLAEKAGIDAEAIEAIKVGSVPALPADDEREVWKFSSELLSSRKVTKHVFEAAVRTLGLTGVIDLVGIIGYYSLICATINAFEVGLPPGAVDPFAARATT